MYSNECHLTSQSSTVQIESFSNFGCLFTSFPYEMLLLPSICWSCKLELYAVCLPVFSYEMLLLPSICWSCKLELYAVIIYYILDVSHVKYCNKVVLLYNLNFVSKFSLLFLNFEVVWRRGGGGGGYKLTTWASDWSVDDCYENCSFHH